MRGTSLLALGMLAWLTAAAFAQQGGLSLSGDQPINIESDKLEVVEAENKAIFTGNVNVLQGTSLMKAGRMVVFYANDGGSASTGSSKIDKIEVDNKVYLKSNEQVATGDQGTFDMKSEILTLTGKEVVLTEGKNILKGCKLIVQMKTGQAKFDGCRVTVEINQTPTSQ